MGIRVGIRGLTYTHTGKYNNNQHKQRAHGACDLRAAFNLPGSVPTSICASTAGVPFDSGANGQMLPTS